MPTGSGHAQLSKKEDQKKMKEKELRRLAQPESQMPEPVSPTTNLCLRAKVYDLGEKYDVSAREGMALNIFHVEAQHYWQSNGFLHAIKEFYTLMIDENRALRDVVVEVVNENRELLDQPKWQHSIRDLSLCLDLLMCSCRRQPLSCSIRSKLGHDCSRATVVRIKKLEVNDGEMQLHGVFSYAPPGILTFLHFGVEPSSTLSFLRLLRHAGRTFARLGGYSCTITSYV
jgi:hypothetical protein